MFKFNKIKRSKDTVKNEPALSLEVQFLSQKLEYFEQQLEEIQKENQMNVEVLLLTTKDRMEHTLVLNTGTSNSYVTCYEETANQLREKGFCIRKTFKKGQLELWVKHEQKQKVNNHD